MKKIFKKILLLVLLFVASILVLIPTIKHVNYGLDLQGGFEVLYQVSSLDGSKMTSDKLTSTYKTIGKRIDTLGVSEPNIVVEGEDKIRVELAGVTNIEEARKILSKAANLTFRDTSDNLLMTSDVISGAKLGSDSNGRPAVALSVKDKETFYKVTKKVSEMSDNRIVIWLDYTEGEDSFSKEGNKCGTSESSCLSVASVGEGFASDVIIQGNFTTEEAETLSSLISSGSLPTKLDEISSKTVDASLGANSLSKTFTAGIIGIALIMVVLICLYRFAGFVSSVGIMIYTTLVFAIFWLVGGVLTLPGIAAVLIGIGMAVDSSVISFSRIKDELKKGSKLNNAVKNGNKNSFASILDGNLTTLVVALILFIFGESSVKGFATMLIISIAVTMFVMVFVVRWLINYTIKTGFFEGKEKLFIGYNGNKERFGKLNFNELNRYTLPLTGIMVVIGIVSLVISGLNLGIDFKGGTSITIETMNNLTEEVIKEDMSSLNYNVYSYEKASDNVYIIKVNESMDKDEVMNVGSYLQEKYEASTDIGVVSNLVKESLVKNAIVSLLIAFIGIIIYVALRFQFMYAVSGLAALIHDVFMMVAIFSLFRLEVTSVFIAAVLSIVGYSINDTIVEFDRIRELIKTKYNSKLKSMNDVNELINTSLKQMLSRTIITTLTTMIPVITLIFFGSHEIFNFNIALLIGLMAGTYSSVLLAPQLLRLFLKKKIGVDLSKKWYEDNEPTEKKVKGVNA